jgi:predicted PurR-regulated permease PerM
MLEFSRNAPEERKDLVNLYFWLYTVLTILAAILVFFICLVLVRLARTLESTNILITDVRTELTPLIGELRVTIDQINSELDNVDEIVQSVQDAGEKVTATASLIQKVVSSPVIKIASFSAGAKQALNVLLKNREGRGD